MSKHYLDIRKKIANLNPSVRLVVISKQHTAQEIRAIHSQGQVWFGENYVQELCEKASELKDLDIYWSFCGTLQSNKIKSLMPWVHEIQTVTDFKKASDIARWAFTLGKTPFPIYISLNPTGENTKSGISLEEATVLAMDIIRHLPELKLKGCFLLPPKEISHQAIQGFVPELYKDIALFAKSIGNGELSLGMSSDFESAILAGSSVVRIGSAIFMI